MKHVLFPGARGINNLGFIVGDSGGRAVLWNPFAATPYAVEDLNTVETISLGWELLAANDINDNGLQNTLFSTVDG